MVDYIKRVVDPSDFWEAFEKAKKYNPEQKLMAAILDRAAQAFLDTDERKRTLFEEAQEWIFEKDNNWLFSFGSVCDHLGLNASYVRGLLAQERFQKEQETKKKKKKRPKK